MPKVTIEQLAIMVKNGFDDLAKSIDSKITHLQTELTLFRQETNERFDRLEARFDSLEHVVGGHTNRIEILEDKVLVLENKQCQK